MSGTGDDEESARKALSALQASIEGLRDEAKDIAKKLRVSRRVQIILGIFAAVIFVVVIGLGGVTLQVVHLLDDFRQSQIEGCRRGNTLRSDIVDYADQRDREFARALQRTMGASDQRLEEFLANLDAETEVPESFLAVDCAAVY